MEQQVQKLLNQYRELVLADVILLNPGIDEHQICSALQRLVQKRKILEKTDSNGLRHYESNDSMLNRLIAYFSQPSVVYDF